MIDNLVMVIDIPDKEHAGLIINRLYELGYDWNEQQDSYKLWSNALYRVRTNLVNKSIYFFFNENIYNIAPENKETHTLTSLYTQEIIDLHRMG